MSWMWHRHSRAEDRKAAKNALQDATKRHEEAVERWQEVHKVIDPLKRARQRNHFADLFTGLGGGPR